MRALVVYESMYGNTKTIAEQIGQGLVGSGSVDVVEVGAAPDRIDRDVDLLVIGGPIHAWGLSRASSRLGAAEKAPNGLVSKGIGLREWLAEVRLDRDDLVAAAFDTRLRSRFSGSAVKTMRRRLRRLGVHGRITTEGFHVDSSTGPVSDGEADRAYRWGETLAARVPVAR